MVSSAEERTIRVTHILTDSNIGGAGKLLCYLIAASDPAEVEHSVILPTGAVLEDELCALGVKVVTVDGIADASRAPKAGRALKTVIKEMSPDILHTHSSSTGRRAGRSVGVPTVMLTKHCSDMPSCWMRSFPGKMLCGIDWRRTADAAIATDDSAAAALTACGFPRKNIRVIYNGAPSLREVSEREMAELRDRLGIPHDALVIGSFARLEEVKAQETLIRALYACHDPKIYCLIVGEGRRLAELRVTAKDYRVQDRVKFCGFVRDIAPYMKVCSMNVNTSVGTETSNLALIEGMSAGVVPIVSNVGGNARIAEGCGRVCPSGDYAAFAEAICELSVDRIKLGTLSAAAKKKYYAHYTSERMAREVTELYRSLTKNN